MMSSIMALYCSMSVTGLNSLSQDKNWLRKCKQPICEGLNFVGGLY